MFLIRFVFYFTLSFAILCIPVGNNEHFFDKLYLIATPYANKLIKSTKQKFSSTKKYSKKLYSNSEPLEQNDKDEVKTKYSALLKKTIKVKTSPPDDTYTEEERERLKRVLNSN